jgi:hypothetical protein
VSTFESTAERRAQVAVPHVMIVVEGPPADKTTGRPEKPVESLQSASTRPKATPA